MTYVVMPDGTVEVVTQSTDWADLVQAKNEMNENLESQES